jgi:hypothetical protein
MLTLPRLVADPPLAGARILGLSIAPDARWLMFLSGSAADSEVLDLWGLPLGDNAAVPRLLVRATDILGQQEEKLSEEERMARERKRIRLRGLVSYSYCGEDGHALLCTLHGDLYHVVPKLPAPAVTRLNDDGGPRPRRPRFAARLMASSKENEVYTVTVHNKRSAGSPGATATLHHGVAGSSPRRGASTYWWSKDERYRLYRVEISPVGIKRRRACMPTDRHHSAALPATARQTPGSACACSTPTPTDVQPPCRAQIMHPAVEWFGDMTCTCSGKAATSACSPCCGGRCAFRFKVLEETTTPGSTCITTCGSCATAA